MFSQNTASGGEIEGEGWKQSLHPVFSTTDTVIQYALTNEKFTEGHPLNLSLTSGRLIKKKKINK